MYDVAILYQDTFSNGAVAGILRRSRFIIQREVQCYFPLHKMLPGIHCINGGNMMDFRTLRYFTAVAQELNFTRAAEKLQMSQPPLSAQIKALEEDLGTQLFIRGNRSLKLTDAGHLFYRRAMQMLELSDKTRSELSVFGRELSGRICLGVVDGRAPFLAARWIAGFHEEFPLVTFSLWKGSSDDVLNRLARGLSDAAIIAAPYDTEHLEGVSVGREPWVAMIARQHPLSDAYGDSIPLHALADQPLIVPARASRVQAIRSWFGEIDREPHILCELSDYANAIALVEQNAGICIFPQTTYTPNPLVSVKVITQTAKYAENVLVYDKSQPPVGLTRVFLDYVSDFLAEDRIHSDRFQVKENVFILPEDATLL